MTSDENKYNITQITCPACGNENSQLITHVLDIPYYTDFMLINLSCNGCGFRNSDFFNLNSKGYVRYEYRVNSKDDDTTKIVRSKTGTVMIPEIDFKLESVNDGKSWIRNVEGILLDIESKLIILKNNPSVHENEVLLNKIINQLTKMKNYEMPFTIVVEDETGNSLIIPSDEKKLSTITTK